MLTGNRLAPNRPIVYSFTTSSLNCASFLVLDFAFFTPLHYSFFFSFYFCFLPRIENMFSFPPPIYLCSFPLSLAAPVLFLVSSTRLVFLSRLPDCICAYCHPVLINDCLLKSFLALENSKGCDSPFFSLSNNYP